MTGARGAATCGTCLRRPGVSVRSWTRPSASGLCEVVVRQNTTAADVLDTLQDARYRDRVAIFHYGGHAGGFGLLLESALGEPVAASAGGLAAFLGRRRGLKLVFLNGCSTEPQVVGLLEAGAPAVIATAHAIDDAMATEFSGRFYAALAAGASVQSAFHEAAAAVSLASTGRTRHMVPSAGAPADQLPWHFRVGEGAELAADWSLPEAASDPLFGLPAPPARDLPENPYLEPLTFYTEAHAEVFFGRGAQIRELYERVTGPAPTAHLAAVRPLGRRQVVPPRRGLVAPGLRLGQQWSVPAARSRERPPGNDHRSTRRLGMRHGSRHALEGGGSEPRPAAPHDPGPGRGGPDSRWR